MSLTDEQRKALKAVELFLRRNVWGAILIQTKPGGFQQISETETKKPKDLK